MASQQPESDAMATLLQGLTPEQQAQLAQLQAQAQNNDPFASELSAMPLFLSRGVSSLSSSKGTKTFTFKFHGVNIGIKAPDYGRDYKYEVHSDLGKDDPRKTRPDDVKIWVELRKGGKVVARMDLPKEQYAAALGQQAVMQAKGEKNRFTIDFQPAALEEEAPDQTGTLQNELQNVYKLSPEALRDVKHKLWLAGYYGDVPLEKINMNIIGQDDVAALTDVMLQASRYYIAGKDITWQELLNQQSVDPNVEKTGKPITLTDPTAITLEANKMASEFLGRKASPKDVQTLIQLIHGKETSQQSTLNQGGTAVGVDVGAQMESYFRENYPDQVMATDWHSAAQTWEEMLKAPPVATPPTVEL